MFTLAFDTTENCCSIALLDGTRVIASYNLETEFGQAEILIPQIDEMLRAKNLRFGDLGLIGVCVGPGSFTGVRSSVAAARAFALACPHTAVTGVTAFEAYAHSLDMSELASTIAVIIETKREDFYVQLFNGRLEKLTDAAALPYEDIIAMLKGKTVTLIGNGVERFLDKPSGLVLHAIRMDKCAPISDVAACAIQKFNARKLNYPKPLYLRAPDVCVKS
ncbi:MAG: tRNA (adenosine(37)-N6)-threonylcarbamoyltransferase complex dimerization subunit type 1 TsaB [Alphaproteobacteria bacterium]|nr:tRNA (adenosine(37)-N6)-threonylcarbamoyltransferase complex dimerization subunit type 1 TsaB [Alphaproteobacteria bacterium]